MAKSSTFTDTNQNFWQLASIQSAAFGVTGLLLGSRLTGTVGAGAAIASICLGNLILWLIGIAIIAMSAQDRLHSVKNAAAYLGKWGGIAAALLMLTAFITWVSVQLESSVTSISFAFRQYVPSIPDMPLRAGTALGVLAALLASGGIRAIKWTCVIAFPLIILTLAYVLVRFGNLPEFKGTWGLSFGGVMAAIAYTLPGIVNLPTFFRHSRSRQDSFFALTIITIFTALLECFSIFVVGNDPASLFTGGSLAEPSIFYLAVFLLLVFISLLCVNTVNIYFASAGWETIIPTAWKAKEFAIVGLIGTAIFVFLQIQRWTFFLEEIFIGFIGCMGVILVAGFLIKIIVRHRPRPAEQSINMSCWMVGCIAVFLDQAQGVELPGHALSLGAATTVLSLLTVVLLEETYWSINQVVRRSDS